MFHYFKQRVGHGREDQLACKAHMVQRLAAIKRIPSSVCVVVLAQHYLFLS